MSGSLAFDRAAGYYDETRGRSPAAVRRETEVLAAEVGGRGTVLEVGVGTGQVALPLAAAGVDVVGIDLARPMLEVLRGKEDAGRVPVVLADATAMPFGDRSFGAAYLRWVLHLIPDWRAAVAEIVRVLRPGAVLAVSLGGADDGPDDRIKARFCRTAGITQDPVGLGWDDLDGVDAAMAEHGASPRALPPFPDEAPMSVDRFMRAIEDGAFSWTWPVSAEVRAAAAADARAWAEGEYGPLDALPPRTYEVHWRAFDLP